MSKKYVVEDFDRNKLQQLYANHSETVPLSVWSPSEVKLLSDTSPYTARNIFDATGMSFPITSQSLEEQAKALVAFLTLSIDNSLFKGIMRIDMVQSKIDNLQKLYSVLGLDCPFSENDVTIDNLVEMSYNVKQNALEIGSRFDRNFHESSHLNSPRPIGFEDFFVDLFGDNLKSILLYGSSAKGDGKDFDLMLFVNDLTLEMYKSFWNKQREVVSDKPVGIVLLPNNALTRYAECDYHSLTIAQEGRLLHGDSLQFPVLSEQDAVNKMYYKSGKEMTSLRGALSGGKRLENLVKSPEFLRETLKLEIWIRKALAQKYQGRYLTKDEFLEQEPISIPNLGQNPSMTQVYDALLDANYRVKQAVDIYVS